MLSWPKSSRLDTSCSMALIAQVAEKLFKKEPAMYIKKTNNVEGRLHEHSEVYFQIPKVKLESLTLSVYSNVSHGRIDYNSSQLGYILYFI